VAVVVGHFTFPQFIAGIPYQGAMAGVAVAIFFVLSGYVIAYVAHQKETTLKDYAVSRLARIYSVALPAIVFTLAADLYLIRHGAPHGLPLYEYKSLWKYLPVFLVFGSEIGWFHAPVFGDYPFWSLSYEVWYYIAFAVCFYLRGVRRLIFGAAVVAILGLPALLYFPIWILGGLLYFLHQRISVEPRVAAIGAIGAAVILVGLLLIGAYDYADGAINAALHGWPKLHLNNSWGFPSFYMEGLLAAANIFFARYCGLEILSGQKVRKIIVYLASFTFAIYLSHWPQMRLWSFVIHHDPHSPASIFALACFVLFGCWCFGFVSEKQKERWRALFRWMLNVPQPSWLQFKMRA
jgi:peptidoglycan/LPS O-acetylase OafA/YrhL